MKELKYLYVLKELDGVISQSVFVNKIAFSDYVKRHPNIKVIKTMELSYKQLDEIAEHGMGIIVDKYFNKEKGSE